jgi:lysophospholipase L1-like esterase
MNNIYYKLLACVCLWFTTYESFSQITQWDSTYRPGAYQLKVDQFRAYKDSKKDIIFLGNSITAGTDWNELLEMPNVKNRGISGDITFGILERLDEVIEGQPAKVFVLIGINDISRNIPDSVIIQNYQKIISRIKRGSPSTKIYFHTLLPTNSSFGKFKNHYNKEDHILWINKALKELANREKITLIDLYPVFLDKENNLEKAYTHDGLHLNASGYKKWSDVLKANGYLK